MELPRQKLGRSTISKVTTLAACLSAVYVATNLLQETDFTPSEQDQLEFESSELSRPSLLENGFSNSSKLDKPVGGFIPFKRIFGNKPRPRPDYPLEADQTGCLGEIKDQGECGSCYAFSLMSLLEWHYCKQTGKLADFSEQYLLDCGYKGKGMHGCEETCISDAKDFISFFGLKWESELPYTGKVRKEQCSTKIIKSRIKLEIPDWRFIPIDREIFEKTLLEQPILLETHLPADIGDYSGGIHSGENCHEQKRHAMLLVGHGQQNDHPFWLLRNTFGSGWGEEGGYLRISRNMPDMQRCFSSAWVGRFQFEGYTDEQSYANLYESFKNDPPERAPRR